MVTYHSSVEHTYYEDTNKGQKRQTHLTACYDKMPRKQSDCVAITRFL